MPIAGITFAVTMALVATTLGTAITLLIAGVTLLLLLLWARFVGKVERSRVRALHRVDLADPIPPLPDGSKWTRYKAMVTTGVRYREVAYGLLHLPVAAVAFAVVTSAWAGSLGSRCCRST